MAVYAFKHHQTRLEILNKYGEDNIHNEKN